MLNPTENTEKQSTLSKMYYLFKDYFINSDDRLVAWMLLIGAVLCVIGLVALMTFLSWWSVGFWAVLTAKSLAPFLICMGQLAYIITTYVLIHILKDYLIGILSQRWRKWLTNKILDELFYGENNFLDLKRFSKEIDNVAQRVQEDVKSIVDIGLRSGMDFLKSVLSLGVFSTSLWIVGGSLSFVAFGLSIFIPGYLVWVALIIAILATSLTYWIGKSLAETNSKAEAAEADFRQSLEELNNDAEEIAQEEAEEYYIHAIKNKIDAINETAYEQLKTKTKLTAFQNFYTQVAEFLPTIIAAPLYFLGAIELGQLMQIGLLFTEVNASLSWFVDSFEELAWFKTSLTRFCELERAFQSEGIAAANAKSICRNERDMETIDIENLKILYPQATSTKQILSLLKWKLEPGEHLLIKGPSGLGKSTLFKAIAGSWEYGDGTIAIPANKKLYFLPQRPVLPYDTLRAVLAFPESEDTYTEEECIAALEAVKGMDDFIPQLQEKRHWSKELSNGQKQRISIARVLLKKPAWLFLDEATSSLDEESEEHIYSLLKSALKETTLVSIAHRSTVEKHHSRIVFFKGNKDKDIEVVEQNEVDNDPRSSSSNVA